MPGRMADSEVEPNTGSTRPPTLSSNEDSIEIMPLPRINTFLEVATPKQAPPRLAQIGATLEALDGRILTRGVADLVEPTGRWTARMTQLDKPGVVASMFFAERARDIVLRLDDGRHGRARIASTSFLAASERICDLTGIEALSTTPA